MLSLPFGFLHVENSFLDKIQIHINKKSVFSFHKCDRTILLVLKVILCA